MTIHRLETPTNQPTKRDWTRSGNLIWLAGQSSVWIDTFPIDERYVGFLAGMQQLPPLCFETRHLPRFLIHQAAKSFFFVFLLGLDFFAMRKDFMEVGNAVIWCFLKHGMACPVILGAARSQMYLVQLSRVSNVNSMKHGQIMDLTHQAYFGGFETDTTSFDEEASNTLVVSLWGWK